jgi:glutathione S-transferase
MLELYHAHISTCSQKVRLCLAEKNLAWANHPVNLLIGEQLRPEYLALNPNGVVPTLVDNGRPIIDSSVICEYLEETHLDSGARLMPDNAYGRARVRAWLRYIEEVPTAAIRIPSFNGLFLEGWKTAGEHGRQAVIARTPLRKEHYRRFGTEGFSRVDVDESMERLRQTVQRIDSAVAGSPWLTGDQISIADLCVTPTIVRMSDIRLEHVWSDLKHFRDWYTRIQARPSFAQAFYPEAHVALGAK